MAAKFAVLFVLATCARGSVVPADYTSFAYDVADPYTGDFKHQVETRVGDAVSGQYSLLDSDGTKRTVDYADDGVSGFNAVVRKDPAFVAAPAVVPAPAVVGPAVVGPAAVGPALFAPEVVETRYAAPVAAPARLVAAPVAHSHASVVSAPVVKTFAPHGLYAGAPAVYARTYAAPVAYAQEAPLAYAPAAPVSGYAHAAPLTYAAHAAPVAYW